MTVVVVGRLYGSHRVVRRRLHRQRVWILQPLALHLHLQQLLLLHVMLVELLLQLLLLLLVLKHHLRSDVWGVQHRSSVLH